MIWYVLSLYQNYMTEAGLSNQQIRYYEQVYTQPQSEFCDMRD